MMGELEEIDMASSKEVSLVTESMPSYLAGVKDNRGSENVGANDLVIPRLELIQGLSKARKKTDPSYVDGAEEGMLYNNVTRELYGVSVRVVPVFFRVQWLLWRDVDLGGGFGGSFDTKAEAESAYASMENPTEWEIVDTNEHFVIIVKKDGTLEEAVLSMAKSKAKTSRTWNSLIRINGGPRFSRAYDISGVPAQNKSGQDYYTLQVKNAGYVSEKVFRFAESVYEVVKGGVGVDHNYDHDITDSETPF